MARAVARGRALRAQLVRILREKKREKIAELADSLGYSYHYFKYSVLPGILVKLEDCIEYHRATDELEWLCDEAARRGAQSGD